MSAGNSGFPLRPPAVEDYLTAIVFQIEWQLLQVGKRGTNRVLAVRRAEEEQEAASSGAGDLAADCAKVERALVELVDLAGADLAGELLLHFPAGVENSPDLVHIVVEQATFHIVYLALHGLKGVRLLVDIGALFGEDRVCLAGKAGVKEHQ